MSEITASIRKDSVSTAPDGGNRKFVMGLTFVATLGGLLFGYDTAVISGTVGALEHNFVAPLWNNAVMASSVIVEFKWIVVVSVMIALGLVCSFLFRLFSSATAALYSVLLALVVGIPVYHYFLAAPNTLTANLANSISGFTVSSALIGCVIGGSIGGYISQTIGRKKGLILAAVLFLISALGSAIPEKINFLGEVLTSFMFYRVIGGIGVGLASMLSPMYIAEIASANMRGRLVSWNQMAIIGGMLVVYFVNYSIAMQGDDQWINDVGWRWMFASEIIPAALFLILLFFVPETPRFLVLAGQHEKAKGIVEKISGKKQAGIVMQEIQESLKEKRAPWMSFGSRVIVIGIMLSIFQQFVGINVVLYYAPKIFQGMGSNTDSSLLQTIIVGAINLGFTLVAIFTVDKFGRKPLQIIGAMGMAFSMLALGTIFYLQVTGMAALLFMLLYVASFAVSWGPVTWVLLSEIFPNSIKGALSIAVAAQWIANFIVSWTFPMMNDSEWLTANFHNGFAYWIYGIFGILAALFMWKIVPETKGRRLEEMEQLWKKN